MTSLPLLKGIWFEEVYHAQIAGGLPMIHKDPFDRMLIAQAQAQRLLLVTDDMQIKKYPVQVLSN